LDQQKSNQFCNFDEMTDNFIFYISKFMTNLWRSQQEFLGMWLVHRLPCSGFIPL